METGDEREGEGRKPNAVLIPDVGDAEKREERCCSLSAVCMPTEENRSEENDYNEQECVS